MINSRLLSLTLPRHCLIFVFVCLFAFNNAQQIIDPSLPSCAGQCTTLQEAQTLCVPPTAPQGSPQTYKTCFCTSNYLQTFKTTPIGICDSVCDSSDLTTIQQWFNSFCADPNSLPATSPATTSTSTAGASTAAAATTTSENSAATSSTAPTQSKAQNQSWISTHWRWVLMVIIIFVAMIVAIVLGLWLKRRHKRRVDARNRAFNSTVTSSPMTMSNPAAMNSIDFAPMAQRSRGPSRSGSRPETAHTKGKSATIGSRELANLEEMDEGKKSMQR